MNRSAALIVGALACAVFVETAGPCLAQQINPHPLPPKKRWEVSSKINGPINALNPHPLPPKNDQASPERPRQRVHPNTIIVVGGAPKSTTTPEQRHP
jgi:hypothetical protein